MVLDSHQTACISSFIAPLSHVLTQTTGVVYQTFAQNTLVKIKQGSSWPGDLGGENQRRDDVDAISQISANDHSPEIPKTSQNTTATFKKTVCVD